MSSDTNFIHYANTAIAGAYKTRYWPMLKEQINRRTPVKSRIKYRLDAGGADNKMSISLSDVTGFGFGHIPEPGDYLQEQPAITFKKMFHRGRIDVEAIERSKNPDGAFFEQMDHYMAQTKLHIDDIMEFSLVAGDGTGKIATLKSAGAVTDNGGGSYTLKLAALPNRAIMKRRMLLSIGPDMLSVFRLDSYDPSGADPEIDVTLISGNHTPANGESVYFQKSKDLALTGLAGIIEGSGNIYGLARQERWQPITADMAGAPLTEQALIELAMASYDENGELGDTILVHSVQRNKLYELARDNSSRVMIVDREMKAGEVPMGLYPTLVLEGKELPIVTSRFMPRTSLYVASLEDIMFVGREGYFVQGTDGVLHSEHILASSDSYGIIWRQWGDFFIRPNKQAGLLNLSDTNKLSGKLNIQP